MMAKWGGGGGSYGRFRDDLICDVSLFRMEGDLGWDEGRERLQRINFVYNFTNLSTKDTSIINIAQQSNRMVVQPYSASWETLYIAGGLLIPFFRREEILRINVYIQKTRYTVYKVILNTQLCLCTVYGVIVHLVGVYRVMKLDQLFL